MARRFKPGDRVKKGWAKGVVLRSRWSRDGRELVAVRWDSEARSAAILASAEAGKFGPDFSTEFASNLKRDNPPPLLPLPPRAA